MKLIHYSKSRTHLITYLQTIECLTDGEINNIIDKAVKMSKDLLVDVSKNQTETFESAQKWL